MNKKNIEDKEMTLRGNKMNNAPIKGNTGSRVDIIDKIL